MPHGKPEKESKEYISDEPKITECEVKMYVSHAQ